MTEAPARIVIVGRDAALWLSAVALQQALAPAGLSIIAIELPSALGAADAYVSLPPLEALHARMGLDESALLRATRGSFTLGHNVVDPADGAAPFFLAHGAYGAPIDGAAFFSYWVKARRFGLGAALEDFCPTAMAARQGRLLLPDDATEVFGRADYGYHLPAISYVGMLKARAARLGVVMHQARAVGIARDGETGTIHSVRIDDGDSIGGDLFIDASGPGAMLAKDGSGVAHEDWQGRFAADRRLTARAAPFATVPAYTELRIGAAGWASLQASQTATYVAYTFAAAEQDDAAALFAASALCGLRLDDVRVTPISRWRAAAWVGNCVAIGSAACALDPLFDVELHAIQLGIVHLLSLFPRRAGFAAERDEYNRLIASNFDRIGEFQGAFYALNRFGDAGFWARARGAVQSPALTHKIATFRARGEIAPMEDETFAPDLWQAMFVGLGEMPESWPPGINRTPPERMKNEFRRILSFVKDKVLEQPTHDAYLADLHSSEAA